jgi:tRNA U34 5-carboxymethylaminomethyl modifying GTPase MnmE/TrmE
MSPLQTLDAQLNVRNYLRTRFPRRPWLDVVSKADLEIDEAVKRKLPMECLYVSTKSGKNIPDLKEKIEKLMGDLKDMLVEKGAVVAEFQEKSFN